MSENTATILVWLVVGSMFAIPTWRIYKRLGYSPLLALTFFIFPLGIIVLWMAAFSWPRSEFQVSTLGKFAHEAARK